jgi:hypothetical protein
MWASTYGSEPTRWRTRGPLERPIRARAEKLVNARSRDDAASVEPMLTSGPVCAIVAAAHRSQGRRSQVGVLVGARVGPHAGG